MSTIWSWIKKHWVKTLLISLGIILALIIPPLVVHIMFKTEAKSPFFEYTWGPGELITYIAGFEAFVGTVFLGIIAVRQNEKSNLINQKLLTLERSRSIFERKPEISFSDITVQTLSFSDLLSKNERFFTYSGFPSKTIDDLNVHASIYHLFTFKLINNSRFCIEAELKELIITNLTKNKLLDYFLVPFADGSDISEISSTGSKDYLFVMDNLTLFSDSLYMAKMKIRVINSAGEPYNIMSEFYIYPTHYNGEYSLTAEVYSFDYKLIPFEES